MSAKEEPETQRTHKNIEKHEIDAPEDLVEFGRPPPVAYVCHHRQLEHECGGQLSAKENERSTRISSPEKIYTKRWLRAEVIGGDIVRDFLFHTCKKGALISIAPI